ncbi:hypothetical protein DL764_003167 [Monosporascus ibericus]|uniref:RING-type domain-containing protein n=1 Tax=Monosporascus ibericus TaxID=155417 RepID=A0A4Q4THN0_9PEZI|nr:hypothetical protein DL764_003167 [Monosporascus ibericus]
MPKHSSHRHRRASEDLRPRDPMPRPSRLPARSATIIDRSSRSRRVYDGDDDDDEDGCSRSRSKSRPRLKPRSSSESSSRHSASDVLEPLPRPARRHQRALPSKKAPRASSSSSSADLTPSASSQDERPRRRAAERQIEVIAESEPEPAEHRRLPRRGQNEIVFAGGDLRLADGMGAVRTPEVALESRIIEITMTKGSIYLHPSERSQSQKAPSSRVTSSHSLGSSSRRSSAFEALFSPRRQQSSDKPAKMDEETRQILHQAKEEGWQRCSKCRILVELKEGCNHMMCRCGAEFCMMCGAKWKSCECPLFNNDTAEQDRLDSMQVPSPMIDRDRLGGGDSLSPRDGRTGRGILSGARSRQPTYEEDMYSRRLQVQEDEDYARRLQYEEPEDDYANGYDEVVSLGNAAGHFMKERNYRHRSQSLVQPAAAPLTAFERTNPAADYVAGVNRARGVRGTSIDRLADRFSEQRQGGSSPMHRPFGNPLPPPALPPLTMSPPPPSHAPPPVQLMRSQTLDDEMFSSPRSIRGSERIIPRRATHDYANEVDVHTLASRQRFREPEPPKDSVLAGFTGPGRGMNRVFEWSKHVEPGLPDNHTVIAT